MGKLGNMFRNQLGMSTLIVLEKQSQLTIANIADKI